MEHDKSTIVIEGHVNNILKELGKIYPEFGCIYNGDYFRYIPRNVHWIETPERVAKALIELFKGFSYDFNDKDKMMTTFDITQNTERNFSPPSSWIIKRDISFSSLCCHHLMPYSGKITIGYMPDSKICGISKLDRLVSMVSQRPELQEFLGESILKTFQTIVEPKAVIVIVKANHTCVSCRGIKSVDSDLVTLHKYCKSGYSHLYNDFWKAVSL